MKFNPDDLDYFPPGEPVDLQAWRSGHDAKAPSFRQIINPADWEGVPVPPRKWIVPDYIPDETVTLLSGDGGTGKSLLAMQLALMKGQIQPAPMHHGLDTYMGEFQPSLTALDVLADMYASDENSRPQVSNSSACLKSWPASTIAQSFSHLTQA